MPASITPRAIARRPRLRHPRSPGSRILPRSLTSAATPSSPDTRPRSSTADTHAASLSSPPRIARRRRVPFGEDILPVLGDRIAPVGVAEQHPIPRARPGGAVPEPVPPGHQPGGVVVFRDLDAVAVEVEEDGLRACLPGIVLGFGGGRGGSLGDLLRPGGSVYGLLCGGLGDAGRVLCRLGDFCIAVVVLR